MYKHFVKRGLDFILSLAGMIVLSPVFLILAVLVRCKLGSPVIFKQERPGKDEKIFTLCKFRTMTNQRDAEGKLLPDSQRLPRFGKLLRATSLDELPELLNILKGDMSIIGPRPLLVSYLPYYTEEERMRHQVRPGLTVMTVLGHSDEVAEDTNAAEGNFAQIRQKRLEETGSLKKPEQEVLRES